MTLTLDVSDVSKKNEDYYWVNSFEGIRLEFGKVEGNFERRVKAPSGKEFRESYKNHKPTAGDYNDI